MTRAFESVIPLAFAKTDNRTRRLVACGRTPWLASVGTVDSRRREALVKEVDAEVQRLVEAEYDSPQVAFAHIAVSALFDLDDDEAYEACEIGTVAEDGPHAFWHDEEGRRILLAVSQYRPKSRAECGREAIRDLEEAYGRVTSPRTRRRHDKLGSVARQVADLRRTDPDYPVELSALCFGRLKGTVSAELRRVREEEASEGLTYQALDAAEIITVIAEKQSRGAPAMSDPVPLTLHDHFLFEQDGQPDALVANLDALELARLEEKYGYRLFQNNVRYLLQGRQKINEGIAKTLREPSDRAHFWYYNNGIAIICDSFDEPTDDDPTTTVVHNFQIVNGTQTTATLARTIEALEDADPPVQILARIIAASDDAALRENIPLYNNRQNAVKDRDLQSNDEVQDRLQREFARLRPKPWFYIRKRGEWEARGNRARYGDRRIENDVAAQAYYAFFYDPGVARARKRYLFASKREGGLYEEIFHDDTTPEALLLPYLLAKYVRRQVARYRREIKDIRPGHGSAADQKKLNREWLKFGEQYVVGVIGWYIRRNRRVTRTLLAELATKRFDALVNVAYPRAVRDLSFVFRRVALEQPANEDGARERIDYANYVKGHWRDVVSVLNEEYEVVREGENPLSDFF